MGLLESVRSPEDLRRLTPGELPALAAQIRDFLVEAVSRTGGHLGPNLGVVELTIALHRVFESPRDRIVWDTGHQAYVHKILTGRQPRFATLRQPGGLSGYPSQAESEHDIVENSHASTALSYADGLAKAYELRGEKRHVVAVIGDGALTGGMAWEALNTIAQTKERPLVIVVNDNGRSYAPTIGGLADHLASLRMQQGYEVALGRVKSILTQTPLLGQQVYDVLHRMKDSLKDLLSPQVMFEDLGLKYVGPIDGHDEPAVESALRRAKEFHGPVIVHCVTTKGFGYKPAEDDESDCLHGVGVFDAATGTSSGPPKQGWTKAFADEMLAIGRDHPEVVGITAAMLEPVGLGAFARAFPKRTFDVGIAEQHAVTSAAGLAIGGMHPFVCLYATFLNRAFDQVLMDVALHRLGVTFILDRAGVTGDDGPSHNGMWDMSILQLVPGMHIAAPRDSSTLRLAMREAVAITDAPSTVRFPKGALGPDIPELRVVDGMHVLREGSDVLVVAMGAMVTTALDAAERVAQQGISVTVVDPRWVKPVNPGLVKLAARHSVVVTVEDNGRVGGAGAAIDLALRDAGLDVPTLTFGIPQRFLEQGKRDALLVEFGLGAQEIARRVVEAVALREPVIARELTQDR
ncbi:MAG: 1-deoxy-D-xylulose-5-phosphate synthase [Actinomycetota bacterium]